MALPFQSSTYDLVSVAMLVQFLQWKFEPTNLDWWAVKKRIWSGRIKTAHDLFHSNLLNITSPNQLVLGIYSASSISHAPSKIYCKKIHLTASTF